MERAWLVVCLVALLPLLQAGEDEVQLTSPDANLAGSVTINGAKFEVSSQGVKQSFSFGRIKTLVFDTDQNDPDWISGQRSFWDGKWNYCYDRMTGVMRLIEGGQEFRPMCVPFAYYYYALSAGKTGHADTSAQYFTQLFAMKEFTKTHPLYSEALGQSALLLVSTGKLDAAAGLIPKLKEADPSMGNYVAAEVALAKNDLDGATAAFTALATSTDAAMKARAMMGSTRVAIAKKDFDGAASNAKGAIAGAKGDDLIQSDAQYYLGVALQSKAATGKNDDEKAALLQQASMAFMRVIAVYGNSSDKRILAADGAIACFDKLGAFQQRLDSLKGIPFGKYSSKIKQWKGAQGAN
ncbi:MAG TPA: hypothetical protein VL860_06395 [Planctomycetota bacterium]|nr:hypothetical protein [Planctomycetota bacterium]